ncbi:unnamed protein product [Ambrosiozyma monospora]|uniref:Unnamed protein product n=1 Tax=Ambrosiozyma monospora TaxID=43982 RepID=A0ACB5TYQ1_AMBMO|nr:unnamed protein product [Ambrosiozyma monospora]
MREKQREQARLEKERERENKKHEREQEKLEKQQRREERERIKRDREKEREKEKERQREFQKRLLEEGDDKLTAFQERYSTGATLVFEYYENTSARFFIPRDSIIEIIDDEADEDGDVEMTDAVSTPVKEEDGNNSFDGSNLVKREQRLPRRRKSPYVDILISFVLVHNQPEIDAWERRQKAKQDEEDAKKKKEEEERLQNEKEQEAKAPPKKRRKSRKSWGSSKRHTRRAAKKEQEDEEELANEYVPEPDEEDVKPTPIYSTSTMKLTEVPFKFAELIKNSGNPVAEVQETMKRIFKEGERLKRFNMWYQLDGVKDELLAETLRFNLNRLDYVNGGGRLEGKAMLKRIVEKTGSEAEVHTKRSRR